MEEIRLNKYLSDAGVCSRREADRLIESGQVLVNGVPTRDLVYLSQQQQRGGGKERDTLDRVFNHRE